MIRVYTYANCDTCRKALKFLAAHQLNANVIPIREQPPSADELRRMLALVGGNLRRLFNTSGQDYKSLDLKERLPRMTEAAAIALLSKNGNLVKRPFLLTDTGGTVGFDETGWERLLK